MADYIGMMITLVVLAGGILGGAAIVIFNIISDYRDNRMLK